MFGGKIQSLAAFKQWTTLLLIAVLLSGYVEPFFNWVTPQTAEAAQVTIDADAFIDGTAHLMAGSQTVFVNDQTGYKFFRDSSGICVYRKTTDGGGSWATPVTVDGQTDCIMVTVWYDRWTPGDTGTFIHIATLDTSADDIYYNSLNTSNDTLLMGTSPVSMVVNTGQSGTIVIGSNTISITKGTDGTIYAVSDDAQDSYIVECTTNCNLTTSWTETGTNPLDNANDYNILVPLSGGNIMIINRDISLEDIRSKIWNNVSWSGTWTPIDSSATDNITYDVGMAVAVSSTTPGTLYLAYIASSTTLGTDDVVRTAKYSGSSWTNTGNVISGTTRGVTNVAIGIDAANDDVYVGYTERTIAGTANTGQVYFKTATSSMMNWSAEVGPINTSADDMYGLDINSASDQRLYATWFDNTDDDIYGETVADIFPGVHASATGVQIASTTAATTSVYIGGAFLFYNTYGSLDLTSITLTESGTIDGSTGVANIKLLYETDTTAPYNCASVSYNGTESQFGSTDSNGFSGANGISIFTGTTVSLNTTTALCVYVVMDILDAAASSSTIDISIANPVSDVVITGSTAGPSAAQNISGTTFVYNDTPTLTHYHWRNDDGSESLATSKTGNTEDTVLAAMRQGSTTRLRMQVSNAGSTSTPPMQYRLEYATNPGSCDAATGWVDVGAVDGDFDMSNSIHLTEGGDTTNIALGSLGAVSDPVGKVFLTPNGGVRDTSSQTGAISLTSNQFVEFEYAIVASTSATEGNTYCFRLTDQGSPLSTYANYPRASISSDVLVSIATSSQTASTNLPATNFYVGSHFIITENTGSRNVTSITISETGTVDAQNGLDNVQLRYDLDVTTPYNCAGETYDGTESQFGVTDTDGFSEANGTSTFNGSVSISTTTTMCVYVVLDSTEIVLNGETLNIVIPNPATDVVVSGSGSVSPTITRDLNGETTFAGAVLTQTHYHWRADNGNEAEATSLSGGIEDTPITNVAESTPVRLRVQVSNEGSVTSASRAFLIEYGAKISTCSAVSVWTNVGDAGGAWDMYDSTNLTEASSTTNIALGSLGAVSDPVGKTFLTANGGVKDTSSVIASTTLTATEFLEAEFSMVQTGNAGFDVSYCFRVSSTQVPLNTYDVYAELTTSPERDFEVQRGTETITGTSTTLVAGEDYVQPRSATSSFIRITNSHYTGAGDTAAGTQNSDDVTAYILNPSNIMSEVTIARPVTATGDTRVSWEIIEFIGEPGSDNEMIVRDQGVVTYATNALVATGTTVSTVADGSDVVVFITGQINPDTARSDYHTGQSTSAWNTVNEVPVFTRGSFGSGIAAGVSYAVVEFTGQNWITQRSEHTYSLAGTTETEAIAAVGSLSRTFLHTQKRIGDSLIGTDEFGHEVWLSSVGFVSYFLEGGATTPSGQTSVAWIIENIQTTAGAMEVTPTTNSSNGGGEPLIISVDITKTLTDLTNASIFVNTRSAGTGTLYPRPIVGATIASTTHYELWRSDTGANMTYRTEIVEWPTAGLALRQTHYRFYVDNGLLIPTDPWGSPDLGEDTVLTETDEPLGEGERIRIRISIQALNASLPAGTRSFKLQYGALTTSCSAIPDAGWSTVGDSASSTVWRGYDVTGLTDGTILSGDPPTLGDLKLLLSDVAGTFEEENDSAVNSYTVPAGDDIEYDWVVEQNGAAAETYYCFRMIDAGGSPLDSYSTNYPQLITASFTPRTQDWRWFDDEMNATPTTSLAAFSTAPINIFNTQTLVLRVTVKETKNIARNDVRFKLQFSEYADFSTSTDVVASGDCIASSTWCYADGAGVDNAVVGSTTLPDSDSCIAGVGDGCGTYNESSDVLTGYRHENNAAAEYSFTIQSSIPHVNTVYYFRLFDLGTNFPVTPNTGESYPSLVTEGAELSFTIAGVASSTVTENITTDVPTTGSSVPYGRLTIGSDAEAAQRLSVTTNAPRGYQIYMMADGHFTSASGDIIAPITTTNAAPAAWSSGCDAGAMGCFGYHAGDDILSNGSARFFAPDTFARFSTTTLDEVVYGGGPVTNDTVDIIYKVRVQSLQEAGQYTTGIRYIAVPLF